MIIANPIYDIVFKQLIQNTRIARFFIETLLEEQITELLPKPQEFQHTVAIEELMAGEALDAEEKLRLLGPGVLTTLTVFRLDYIATIRTASGEYKKVLIEVQKARNSVDVMRFRNYLSAQYRAMEDIVGQGKQALPVVTIYLLGFQLDDLKAAVTKVARNYMNQLLKMEIKQKNEFIELLTHDSYFIQLRRISQEIPGKGQKLNSKLEELLAIFEQKYFLDERGLVKEYSHDIQNPVIKLMLDILEHSAADPAKKKELEDEAEVWRVIEGVTDLKMERLRGQNEQKDKKIEEQKKELEQKDKALEQKDQAIEQKDKTIEQKDQALEQKDLALEQKDKALEAALKELAKLRGNQSQ